MTKIRRKVLVGWIRDDWHKKVYIGKSGDDCLPTVQMPNIFKNKSAFDRQWIPWEGVKVRITLEQLPSKKGGKA